MKKTAIDAKDFRLAMDYLGVTLQEFAYFSGFSLDYIRSLSCGRREASIVMFRLINALLDQQETGGTNDCKRHALGELQ